MKTVEEKIIQGWQTNKEIFDSLKVGNIVQNKRPDILWAVTSKDKDSVLISRRFENTTDIENLIYNWNENSVKVKENIYFTKNMKHYNKWAYEEANKILTEAGL